MNKKLKIMLVFGILLIGSIPVSAVGLKDIIGGFFDKIISIINDFWNMLLDELVDLLTWNPDIIIVKPLMDDFIELAAPLYIIAFMIIGIYFFFLSESPKGRAKARAALLRLLISLAFIMVAPTIYQFLLDLSELLVNFVMSDPAATIDLDIVSIAIMSLSGYLFGIVICLVLLGLLILFALRYLALLILAAIFPLTIFLFFFEFTKDYGRQIMRYTIMLIFVPVLQAIILVFVISTVNSLGAVEGWGNQAGVVIVAGGFILMIVAPLIALGLLKWIGGIVAFWAFKEMAAGRTHRAMVLFFAGGLMMGEGAGAVPLAATLWFIGQLEHGSEKVGERLYKARRKRIEPREYAKGEGRGEEGPKRPHIKPEGPGWVETGGETPRGRTAMVDARIAGDRYTREGYRLMGEERPEYKKRFETAIERYEKAIRLSDGAEMGKTGEALADAEKAGKVLSKPEKAEIYAKMGDTYVQLERTDFAIDSYEKAIESCERAIELNPEKRPEYTPKLAEYTEKRADMLRRRG